MNDLKLFAKNVNINSTRKHLMWQFYKFLFLQISIFCSWSYDRLQNRICSLWWFFLLENLMCSNEIVHKISWKIWSVLMIFFPSGKSYVFLRNFEKALLEILMYLVYFTSPERFIRVLVPFWFSWKSSRYSSSEKGKVLSIWRSPTTMRRDLLK